MSFPPPTLSSFSVTPAVSPLHVYDTQVHLHSQPLQIRPLVTCCLRHHTTALRPTSSHNNRALSPPDFTARPLQSRFPTHKPSHLHSHYPPVYISITPTIPLHSILIHELTDFDLIVCSESLRLLLLPPEGVRVLPGTRG